MPYVRDGAVVSRRSPYRLSIVTDIFWSVVNLIAALCVPARAPSTRSRARLRLRARLRFVALTPVSLLSDTRAARPKQLSVHARPRVRGVVRREAAAKARGRVRRQRRRRPGRRRGGPGAEAEAAPAETCTARLASAGSTTAPLRWAAEAGRRLPFARVMQERTLLTRTHGGALSLFSSGAERDVSPNHRSMIRAPSTTRRRRRSLRRFAVESNDAPFRILSSHDREWVGADTQTIRSRSQAGIATETHSRTHARETRRSVGAP